jgi:hypothetical protein
MTEIVRAYLQTFKILPYISSCNHFYSFIGAILWTAGISPAACT